MTEELMMSTVTCLKLNAESGVNTSAHHSFKIAPSNFRSQLLVQAENSCSLLSAKFESIHDCSKDGADVLLCELVIDTGVVFESVPREI